MCFGRNGILYGVDELPFLWASGVSRCRESVSLLASRFVIRSLPLAGWFRGQLKRGNIVMVECFR